MSSNHPSDNALIFSHLVAYNLIGYAVYIQTEQNLYQGIKLVQPRQKKQPHSRAYNLIAFSHLFWLGIMMGWFASTDITFCLDFFLSIKLISTNFELEKKKLCRVMADDHLS